MTARWQVLEHLWRRVAYLCLLLAPRRVRRRYAAEILDVSAARIERTFGEDGRWPGVARSLRELAGILRLAVVSRHPRRRANGRSSEPGAESVGPVTSYPNRRSREMVWPQDLRYALRNLVRRPLAAAVAVITLALGVGANVAIFSVLHEVLLRPLGFHRPERLYSLWEKNRERGWHQAQVAAANYLDWREQAESFEDMAAHNDWLTQRALVIDGQPTMTFANEVTGNFFSVLGVEPLHGRTFDDADTWEGGESAVVLSYPFWARVFDADPGVIGQRIVLDEEPHTVRGVMPANFEHPFRQDAGHGRSLSVTDLWLPVTWPTANRGQAWFRRAHGMRVIGRLRAGSSAEEAEAELAAIAARLEAAYPETNVGMGNGITPLREWIIGDTRTPLLVLSAAVGLVLLVACTNVANVLLAQGASRRREMAVRSALGASRRRLLAQGLIESLLLALLGGIAGLVIGLVSLPPLLALAPSDLPRLGEVGFDPTLFVFALALSVLTGLVFGAWPAYRSARAPLGSGLGAGPRTSSSRRSQRVSSALVAAEVALTLPLVIAAGLMLRTVFQLSQVDPGFASDHTLVASISLPGSRYEDSRQVAAFYRQLLERARGLPGVEAVAMSSRLPFGNQRWSSDFSVEGWPADRYGSDVRHDEISPGLFELLRVPLSEGRDFTPHDDFTGDAVVIVNQALADRYFRGESPIGRRVTFDRIPDGGSFWRTIVGVVGNVRRESLALEEQPSFYAPVLQDVTRGAHLLVRTEGEPLLWLDAVRREVAAVDPGLPLYGVTTLDAVRAESIARERFVLVLLAMFAALALALAAVGIYGVLAYVIARKVREIGVRVALGAARRDIAAFVLRRGMAPVLAGIVIGLGAAGGLTRWMTALLFGVGAVDLATYVVVAGLIAATALLACAFPARSAMRSDPIRALRTD